MSKLVVGEHAEMGGIIRRRRDFSKNLAFFSVELQNESDIGMTSLQFVCDGWEAPRTAVTGSAVRAVGTIEYSPKGEFRFLVNPNGLQVLLPVTNHGNGWMQASVHADWRIRSALAICVCTDLSCSKWHNDAERWIERKRLRCDDRSAISAALTAVGVEEHPKGSAESKAKHNFVFAAWVLDRFPRAVLDGGVVDIAGGRGMIAMKLALEHNIRVSLVEPKEVKLNKTYRKKIRKYWRRKNKADTVVCSSVSEGDGLEQSDLTGRSRADVGKSNGVNNDLLLVADNVSARQSDAGSVGEADESKSIELPMLHFREDFFGVETASPLLKAEIHNSELLLAMHPDAATGAVLETAVSLKKSFAIVPCCVFGYMFPSRQTKCGKTVTTYEEFVDYLEEFALSQGANVKRCTLPFEGRNIVLYCTEYYASSSSSSSAISSTK